MSPEAPAHDPETPPGVAFPAGADGRRSTSAFGRAVVADALAPVDAVGSAAAARETNWRSGYLVHARRLVEAGLPAREAALAVARAGLDALHDRMRSIAPDGQETSLSAALAQPPGRRLRAATVTGRGTPERELSLPYRGRRLRGAELEAQLERWLADGVMEPSAAEAVRRVAAHPEWLALPGRQVVVVGAGAEMGPLPSLLRWGARVVALDLPRPALWKGVLEHATRGAGTLVVPVDDGAPAAGDDPARLAQAAGADLTTELAAVAAWLDELEGGLVLGNYVYADGAANVRVAMAVDALTAHLQSRHDDLALAFLATPTDVFAVPGEAVEHAVAAYGARSRAGRLAGRPLRMASGGRLLRRAYVPGSDPGINDTLVAQQGPNYTLAKRLQRWRAALARDGGALVSLNVAPPTRTRSVVKNRALAAAYAGAHRFGVEVFEPATSNTLMAALLVDDLCAGHPPAAHPWQDEAHAAVHGGLWRSAYEPRSVLGLAALLGAASARG